MSFPRHDAHRRRFLRLAAAAAGALAAGPALLHCVARPVPGPAAASPYGPLATRPDASGLLLPQGFTSRILARTGERVPGTDYTWHEAPDGGACFAQPDGGWVYVSNSEALPEGGVGALRFDAKGEVASAYRILSGTRLNCAGGPTPWGTWLSGEEARDGRVWECDVTGPGQGVVRPALGTFVHEAVTVDPVRRQLYLTEDTPDGRFYRFTPAAWPSLEAGLLEAAVLDGAPAVGRRVSVRWVAVSQEEPARAAETAVFQGGEGCWYDGGTVYFTTKHDHRVWALDAAQQQLEVLYSPEAFPGAPLRNVDNVTVARSGDIVVAEDGDDLQLCVLTPERGVFAIAQVGGHMGSELAGPAFSPDGTRLYFSSQRGNDGRGVTYEVRGPFRQVRP